MNSWNSNRRNPDGSRVVTDHGPSHAAIPGHRGSLVVGGPGPNDRDRKHAKSNSIANLTASPRGTTSLYATDEERIEARRRTFREAKRRQRAAARGEAA